MCTLKNFNDLAYEFAIRNPCVIKLLHSEIDESIVKELHTFGIDATFRLRGNIEYGLKNLYLEYEHFEKLKHKPYCEDHANELGSYYGDKFLFHPKKENPLYVKEDDITAYNRIKHLIETRGNKLENLLNGNAFKDYDKNVFKNNTIYKIDPSTNRKKTIKTNIEFIKEWIEPEKYLQLIPQYILITKL